MKNKTKRNRLKFRLQLRFMIFSVSSLVILQSLIVCFTLMRSYHQMTIRADRIILAANDDSSSSETADARYFKVTCNLQDKRTKTDLTHTSLVTRNMAIEYAKKVIESNLNRGYLDDYRFLVHREKNTVHITFLARSVVMQSFRNNAESLIIISLGGIIIMTLFLLLVSESVVSPIVENRQKQREFITSASHELKTPLTVINADAQLLESEIGENEWLSDIIKQTAHMTDMTNRLVYLSRAEEEENHFIKIDFPISDVAEEITDSYKAVAKNSGREFKIYVQPRVSYRGDERAIRELMKALLDNAFKYGSENGTVSAKLLKEANENHTVRFTVENSVSKKDFNALNVNLTDRFFRAENSIKKDGFGIGLSIANTVARVHKGKIEVSLLAGGKNKNENTIIFSAILK